MRPRIIAAIGLTALAAIVVAGGCGWLDAPPLLGPVRAEFALFALTLLGVALLHEHTLPVALSGLLAIVLLRIGTDPGFGLLAHLHHEASILTNLLGLLLGFAVLARLFEQSNAPELLPHLLPDDWKGGLVLLVAVFVMSAFLDNIAAALIGGAAALHLYKHRVHIGFIAAIVAASNAGGSGSVVGDTTTTMMWIDGVNALDVLHAYAAAVPALLFVAVFAAHQQQAHQPIQKDDTSGARLDPRRIGAVVLVLVGCIVANVAIDFPAAGVWAALLLSTLFTRPDWSVLPGAFKGSIFLLALVLSASLMPVEELPAASWRTAFGLGFVSAVFDNIPLTKLALDQGGYDWGMLAYAVGYGGSMIWFGSSAGVAISSLFPQAKSVGSWLRSGWHVTVGYVLGFAVLMLLLGWQPHAPHR